jgi:pimeloyl-ACP methyl ester carboxylesterase
MSAGCETLILCVIVVDSVVDGPAHGLGAKVITIAPVMVDGHRVGVRRFGTADGWPLVWCHGGLSSALDARFFDDAGRRCGADIIALDRPGVGRSEFVAVSDIAHWAPIVGSVADRLGLQTFAVAGWSAGGPYALAVAAALPGGVRAVATLAGMAPLRTFRQLNQLGMWADLLLIPLARRSIKLTAAALALSRFAPSRYLAWELRRTAGPKDRKALDANAIRWIIDAHREATVLGVRGTAEDYRRFGGTWGFDLATVHQPVTVWQGLEDSLLPMTHAVRMASALPNCTFRTVSGAGHYLPAIVAADVLEDLKPA